MIYESAGSLRLKLSLHPLYVGQMQRPKFLVLLVAFCAEQTPLLASVCRYYQPSAVMMALHHALQRIGDKLRSIREFLCLEE